MAQARMSRCSFLQACHALTGFAGSALWVHFQSAMQAVLVLATANNSLCACSSPWTEEQKAWTLL